MIDQTNINDTQCLLLGSETIPDTLNKQKLFLYTTILENQAGLTNM